MSDLTSKQVSWWSVHEFVLPKLQKVGEWPMAGTPAWCVLDPRDPVKWAACLDAGRHWALRIETGQVVVADAAKEIAVSEDWSAIAQSIRSRAEFYAAKPWLNRAVTS